MSATDYYFSVEDATIYGLEEAVFIRRLEMLLVENVDKDYVNKLGRTWSYSPRREILERMPFWSETQLRRIEKSLVAQGVIETRNDLNKDPTVMTLWYSFTDEHYLTRVVQVLESRRLLKSTNAFVETNKRICQNQQMYKVELENKLKNKLSNKTCDDSFDFESLYKLYPRKEGKQLGFKEFKKQITSKELYESLVKAIGNYVKRCEIEKTKKQFMFKFSNFLKNWEDYVNYDFSESGKETSVTTNQNQKNIESQTEDEEAKKRAYEEANQVFDGVARIGRYGKVSKLGPRVLKIVQEIPGQHYAIVDCTFRPVVIKQIVEVIKRLDAQSKG